VFPQARWVCQLELGFLMRLLLCQEEVSLAKQARDVSPHKLALLYNSSGDSMKGGKKGKSVKAKLPSLLFLKDFIVHGTKVELTLKLGTYDTATEKKARLLLKKQVMQVGGSIPIRVALPDLSAKNEATTQKSLTDIYFQKLKQELNGASLLYDIGGKAVNVGLGGRAWSGREKGAGGTGSNFWEDISRKIAKDDEDNAPDLGWKFRAHKIEDNDFFSKHRRLFGRLSTYPQMLRQLEHVCYDWSYNHATLESRKKCAVIGIVNQANIPITLTVDMHAGADKEWLSSSKNKLKPRRNVSVSDSVEGRGAFATLIAWSNVPTIFNGFDSELVLSLSSVDGFKITVMNGEVQVFKTNSSESSMLHGAAGKHLKVSVEVTDAFKW
jgi:hypothetical protein